MPQKKLYDISVVCKMLGISSRTLRFYEEKGLITSATTGFSPRRCYTEEQISHVRDVLVLRTLGLSIKTIAKLQAEKADLKEVVLSKRAEIYASIESRMREIHLLNEALSALESGKTLFNEDWHHPAETTDTEWDVARVCTEAIVNGENDVLYAHLSARLARYMPREVYSVVRQDTLAPLGQYVSVDRVLADDSFPNKVYAYVRYAALGLKITFVFHNGEIDGLWLGYYDTNT